MAHLCAVLAGGGPDTQHSAISAVASAAEAAGGAFAPYVPGVLPHLRRYMDLTQARPIEAFLKHRVGHWIAATFLSPMVHGTFHITSVISGASKHAQAS